MKTKSIFLTFSFLILFVAPSLAADSYRVHFLIYERELDTAVGFRLGETRPAVVTDVTRTFSVKEFTSALKADKKVSFERSFAILSDSDSEFAFQDQTVLPFVNEQGILGDVWEGVSLKGKFAAFDSGVRLNYDYENRRKTSAADDKIEIVTDGSASVVELLYDRVQILNSFSLGGNVEKTRFVAVYITTAR